jgi:hypothetical protein
LLQLMREYDSRLRFQCAACIGHLSKGAQQHGADKVRPQLRQLYIYNITIVISAQNT